MVTPDRSSTRQVSKPDEWPYGDVVPPIHLSSTFQRPAFDPGRGPDDLEPADGEYLYSRLANPTRRSVERQLAALEGGEAAFAFASGTAAIATAALAVLEPGDRLVASRDLYVGTRRLFEGFLSTQLGFEVTFVDGTEPERVAAAVDDDTGLVWVETPTNPTLRLCDIDAIADQVKPSDAVLGVDNTFASPVFQRPLQLGADLVAHSTTKYLNGHSDSIGGALVTDDSGVAEATEFLHQIALGNPMSPFDCYLLSRGLRTLELRMDRHESNALELGRFLLEHDRVTAVHHPGLPSHPQSELARSQMRGFGGTFSFEIDGGTDAVGEVLTAMEETTLAVSLGGVETLVCHPATMTHEPLGEDRLAELGVTDSLIRVSVGIEDVDRLKADFARGLGALDG